MELGFALPHYDFSVPGENPLPWDVLATYAADAERSGFEALYVSDHLFLDVEKYGAGPGVYGAYEPLVTLAALSRVAPQARLGTLVLCEALRPAAVLAKALATLDQVTGGRLDVGLGAGWYGPEYEALGMKLPPAGERVDRLTEALEIVGGMLRGDAVSLDGRFHTARDAVALPGAVQQPRPRVFLGAKGDRLLRLVAEKADGWNTVWVWEPDAYAERVSALDRACEDAGRDPASVWRSLGLYTLVGEDAADLEARYERMRASAPGGMLDGVSLDDWRKGRMVGTVDEVRQRLREFAALGVDQFVACVGPLPFSVSHPGDVALAAEALSGID